MSSKCGADDIFNRLAELVNEVLLEVLTKDQGNQLAKLVDEWTEVECEDGCHTQTYCPFKRCSSEGLLYLGYVNLWDLLARLTWIENVSELETIPHRPGLDVMKAPWARRPGHFKG